MVPLAAAVVAVAAAATTLAAATVAVTAAPLVAPSPATPAKCPNAMLKHVTFLRLSLGFYY